MIIPINNDYRISSDEHSWSIQKSRERKRAGHAVVAWEAIRWYATFDQAVAGLGNLMVRTSETATLVDALVEVERIATTLSQALAPQYKVVRTTESEDGA